MKDKTPDELHAALNGQVIRLDPHAANALVVCMRAEAVVITALRSMPTAPQTWYSPTDTAYLVKAGDVGRLTAGLRSFGAAVIGDAAPLNSPGVTGPTSSSAPGAPRRMAREGWPAWCGVCDERTRQRDVPNPEGSLDHPTVMRCPECHPLRAEPLPGMHGRRAEEALTEADVEAYQAGVRSVREELARLRARRPGAWPHATQEPAALADLIADLEPEELLEDAEDAEARWDRLYRPAVEGDDEAHPF